METSLKMNIKVNLEDIKAFVLRYPCDKNTYMALNSIFWAVTTLDLFAAALYLAAFFRPAFVHNLIEAPVLEQILPYFIMVSIFNGVVAVRKLYKWLSYLAVKKEYRKITGKDLPFQIEICETFIRKTTDISNHAFEWHMIELVQELQQHFILFIKQDDPLIIPKRFFKNQKELDYFKELIRKKLPPVIIRLKDYKMDENLFNREAIQISHEGSENKLFDSSEQSMEHLSYRLDNAIRRKAARTIYLKSKTGKILTFITILLWGSCLVCLINLNKIGFNGLYVSTIVSLLFTLTVSFSAEESIIGLLKKGEDVMKGCHIAYNEEELIIYKSSGETKLKWAGIYQVKEHSLFFIIYITQNDVFVIPKSVFHSNPQQLERFYEIISHNSHKQ